jgi:pimeloyl-ACP methyl ester carboxylesterase
LSDGKPACGSADTTGTVVTGTVRTLVTVPGLGLDEAAWRPTVDALGGGPFSATRTVCLPGYGQPAARGADLRPRSLAAVLLDRLPGQPCWLAGHSASCQVVIEAAVADPERVRGLILVGPTTDPRAATWPALAGRWLGTAVHESPWQAPSLVRQYWKTGLVPMARAMSAARRHRADEAIRRIAAPALIIRGRHDRIAPEDWVGVLAENAPTGSVAITLLRGGHMVPLTHGALVAAQASLFGAAMH